MTNGPSTATIETLTAEVRVLMVGSRQVTMSVYNQLDYADLAEIEGSPFGRVHPRDGDFDTLYVVARHEHTGALVRCRLIDPRRIEREFKLHRRFETVPRGPGATCSKLDRYAYGPDWHEPGWGDIPWATAFEIWTTLVNLPLIVLAGLR